MKHTRVSYHDMTHCPYASPPIHTPPHSRRLSVVLRDARARSGPHPAYEIAHANDGTVLSPKATPLNPAAKEPFRFCPRHIDPYPQGENPFEDYPRDRSYARRTEPPCVDRIKQISPPILLSHPLGTVRRILRLHVRSSFLTFDPAARILHTPTKLAARTGHKSLPYADLVRRKFIEYPDPHPLAYHLLGAPISHQRDAREETSTPAPPRSRPLPRITRCIFDLPHIGRATVCRCVSRGQGDWRSYTANA